MTRPVRDQVPTWTSLVLDELVRRDDLVSASELVRALGCTRDQMWAATHELVKHKAAVRVESDREAHFFATPGDDNRTKLMPRIAVGITSCTDGGGGARSQVQGVAQGFTTRRDGGTV
jgi:hypothetical protein